MQKSKLEDKGIYGSKIAGGAAHGGGGSHGGQSHGNGNSGTPKGGGAAAVIPVYTAGAGAANRNRQHHGAANCNLNKIIFSSTLMMIFVYPLILLFLLI